MTLRDLRNIFDHNTQFVLWITTEEENNELIMTNRLWGTNAIAGMEVQPYSVFTEDGVVYIKTDMPLEVFRAWEKAGEAEC